MLVQPQAPVFARPNATALGGSSTLHVCTIISNPVRYASRYKLYEAFKAQNDGAHIVHWTVEIAYGHRPFVVTDAANPQHLQLRTTSELWHKENALNLLFAHVISRSPDAEYFAWVDADVSFARPDWAYETLQQLQHYQVVQMFSHAQDLGPKFEPIGELKRGWVWMYYNEPAPQRQRRLGSMGTADGYYGYAKGGYWHPGFAWAARRSALDAVGQLLDVCIAGSADWHMAAALIGEAERTLSRELHPRYKESVLMWQNRAETSIRRNIGYVHGLLNHHWHGRKVDRQYSNRWRILVENGYNPAEDLIRDSQGLYSLSGRSPRLRDDLRSYFRSRHEDSIDL
ncbi:MAG: hypothetical protein OHK0021_15640 [Bryobacter sp.]